MVRGKAVSVGGTAAIPQTALGTSPVAARRWLADLAAVAAITIFVAFFSGAESFTFLHTPDSEFYLSLGAFGSEVTDRAPEVMYYWTKFGINLPILALTEMTDPWTARLLWRILLILMVVASSFAVARTRASRLAATTAALFVALNGVMIGYLADPYFSGSSMALLCIVIALSHHILFSRGGLPSAFLLGMCLAWILMINPYSMFIAICALLGITSARIPWLARLGLLRLELLALSIIAGFAVGYGGFILWGRSVFPGLDWLGYVKGFILTASPDQWAEPSWDWLASETSLLVPAVAALVALGITMRERIRSDSIPLVAALGLVMAPLFMSLAYKIASGSAVLEAGYYSSLLWPSALIGLVIVATSVGIPEDGSAPLWGALVLNTIFWIAAGNVIGQTIPWLALLLSLAISLLVILVVGRAPVTEAKALLAVLGVLGALFQLDQNGRPPRSNGLVAERADYNNAYRANETGEQLRRNLAFQEWLLANTDPTEKILLWAPGLETMAAMQLWGPNALVQDEDGRIVGGYGTAFGSRPTETVVTLARGQQRSQEMAQTLRRSATLGEPTCREFALVGQETDVARACILRPLDP